MGQPREAYVRPRRWPLQYRLLGYFRKSPAFLILIIVLDLCSISNCTCPARCLCFLKDTPKTVKCMKQGILEFPENINDTVEQLDLSDNFITEISKDVNRLVELQYLNLARNRLRFLPETFETLTSLKSLDLSENNIADVTSIKSISQLPALLILYLSKNPLVSFHGLTHDAIQAIDVSHCGIKELSNSSLKNLPELVSLNLAGNPLKTIYDLWSPKLRLLDVSNSLLTYLKPDTFIGFPELEELKLADNPGLIYSTSHSTLVHPNLKRFDVSRCNLKKPNLHGFPLLTQAKLSKNNFHSLPEGHFMKNKHLTHLFLNSNGLEHISRGAFDGLPKLQVLDLSVNNIANINWITFQNNLDLVFLNISINALHQIPNLTSAATIFDISSNHIKELNRELLPNMYRLKTLYLNDNQLVLLPKRLKSPTLRALYLRRNRLIQLNNESFSELPELMQLDLSGNRLTEVPSPSVFQNNMNLAFIVLKDNPWRCDCEQLYEMYNYLTSLPFKVSSTSSLICQSPANVSGYSWESACYNVWNAGLFYNRNRTWGLVLVSLVTAILLFGSIVSIRHTMKLKRRRLEERQRLERAEARERLRLLQRRNHLLQEEIVNQASIEPRIHPMELIRPPSYEEAIHMARLAHSLDALNDISIEQTSMRMVGSMDNLRSKKRRPRRIRKRAQSEDDLLRREERREDRIRRRSRERIDSVGNISVPVHSQTSNQTASRIRRVNGTTVDEAGESGSIKSNPRPQTPNSRKRLRRPINKNGHSTDDEDSDIQNFKANKPIIIRELKREPRSGYRENASEGSA
ncbi:leucine-rich repeat-containing protein 15 [Prorops nasuta]|uniref:leucine-rich repeat-containing protein 15 n=1 Tax=Prorops nasuta TaxID=863751 RepID=UPI0034CE2FAC